MLVRAKTGFAGAFSMRKGEVKECSNKAVLQDLLEAGYVEEAKQENALAQTGVKNTVPKTTVKGGKVNESKRNQRK